MADNRPDALGLHMYESLDKETIGELSSKVRGQIIRPHDDGYHQARAVFYGGIDRHPALIIRVADATNVSRAIALARERTGARRPQRRPQRRWSQHHQRRDHTRPL